MGWVFDIGFKACDLASSAIVGFDWPPEALLAEFAGIAVYSSGGVGLVVQPSSCGVDRARARHQLARRARGSVVGIEGEVFGLESFYFFGLPCCDLLRQWVWIGFVLLLVLKALIAAAHPVVGDQCGDAVVLEVAHIGIAVVTSIGCDQGVRSAVGCTLFNHG